MAKAGCEAHIDLTYLLISGSDIQLCFHIPGGGMAAVPIGAYVHYSIISTNTLARLPINSWKMRTKRKVSGLLPHASTTLAFVENTNALHMRFI
ncbi:hypothetical protein SCLCIDRAFT_293567 [Scleroderma citrinum Foug A]|uniref:Uncharacterized protein n=1 Tax=Scleroderma citrinum Foug A TaxID=1036808 RepID=A0A0C2ZZ53_9AGAM|nr:hypothetical protein SCLCIDRAFT_293567 [Scleroderma citrinum Foug A]